MREKVGSARSRGHGGEEVLLELEGEGRPVEGVGHHGGGVPEQAQNSQGPASKTSSAAPAIFRRAPASCTMGQPVRADRAKA